MQRRRLLERLELLCNSGAGLEAIAVPACEIARDLALADSASIFWRDSHGQPAGFYHDCAPAELKDLFVTRFEELFSDADQFNMVTMTEQVGPPIGRMLDPAEHAKFRASNVYKYLCQPLGHQYNLDIRVDVDGRSMAVIALWNREGRPFQRRHAEALEPILPMLQAAAIERQPAVRWRSSGVRNAHLITDLTGERLLAINAAAEALLSRAHLLRQNVPHAQEVRTAPSFAVQLAAMLAQGAPGHLTIPVAAGRLAIDATPTKAFLPDGSVQEQLYMAVDVEAAEGVLAAEWVSALPLTLLQKELALFAIQGGARGDCEARFGVGAEALKKHLRAVYDATNVSGWTDLARVNFDPKRR